MRRVPKCRTLALVLRRSHHRRRRVCVCGVQCPAGRTAEESAVNDDDNDHIYIYIIIWEYNIIIIVHIVRRPPSEYRIDRVWRAFIVFFFSLYFSLRLWFFYPILLYTRYHECNHTYRCNIIIGLET